MRDDCITIALGLPEVRVIREEETATEITVEVGYRRQWLTCPYCGRRTAKVHSTRPQRKRDRRLWEKPVFLTFHKRRFRCLKCGKTFTEPDPVCGFRRRSSRRLREYLGREALYQTVRRVAHKEGVGKTLVPRWNRGDRRGQTASKSPRQTSASTSARIGRVRHQEGPGL